MADAEPHFDPLLDASPLPFGAPAFDRVHADLFLPAFATAIETAVAAASPTNPNCCARGLMPSPDQEDHHDR